MATAGAQHVEQQPACVGCRRGHIWHPTIVMLTGRRLAIGRPDNPDCGSAARLQAPWLAPVGALTGTC